VLVSADGELSTTAVGRGELGEVGANEFRTIDYR